MSILAAPTRYGASARAGEAETRAPAAHAARAPSTPNRARSVQRRDPEVIGRSLGPGGGARAGCGRFGLSPRRTGAGRRSADYLPSPMRRRRTAAAAAALIALAVPGAALGAFPGTDPNESVRANAPNDPDFDRCEPDNEGGQQCSNVFGEEYARFGFAPASTQNTATYHNPGAPHTQRLMAQNTAAGRTALGQVSGVSADRAWKYSVGDPEVQVAILDTGIAWDRGSLRRR